MGKSRTKRFGNMRLNPTGLISEKDIEMDDDVASVPSSITNIVEKLQAPDPEERSCGCQLLASIVSQPKAIGYLLKQNVVKITAPLILDSCADVRKSALGALRNMSVYGQADVCDSMVAHDVLTPLAALIKQYDNSWVPQKGAGKYDTSTDVLVEAMELLSNLCESNNVAVQWFNKEDLLRVILPLVKVETYGYGISTAVAGCLHIVSENNPAVSRVCQQAEVLAQLLSIVSAAAAPTAAGVDGVLFKTLITGILLNLADVDLTPYYSGIVASIAEILDMDSSSVIAAMLEESQAVSEEMNFESEKSWPEVDKLLNAQGISLELLANLCSCDDDWEDMEDHGSGESSDDQAMEACSEAVDMEKDRSDTLCLPSEIASAFVEKGILLQILKKASCFNVTQISKLEASECGRTTLKKLYDLQSRALLCLSNIISVIDQTSFSQLGPLSSIWSELYQLASASRDVPNESFKWALTSAMRAVIQRLAETQQSDLSDVTSTDLDFLVGLAQGTSNRETRINILRIISTVGCVLSVNPQLHPLLQKIGSILVEVSCHDDDIVVVAEALDSLFDMFKEDNTDPVVREIGLVEKLVALQPAFKSKVASQRKKLGENYSVVMMAKANLAGYIKYKLSQK